MKVVSKDDEKMVVELTLDEVRAIGAMASDLVEGPYKIAVDEWDERIAQPRTLAESLLERLTDAL